jgi:2-polyprenyl-3-methyl-5-hydroxy-6-metoxy-1,4-benzoquinol methylase
MSVILAEYLFNFTKIGTHQYSKFIKPSFINKILENILRTLNSPTEANNKKQEE